MDVFVFTCRVLVLQAMAQTKINAKMAAEVFMRQNYPIDTNKKATGRLIQWL
jgi:hypothetical protein